MKKFITLEHNNKHLYLSANFFLDANKKFPLSAFLMHKEGAWFSDSNEATDNMYSFVADNILAELNPNGVELNRT